MQVRTGERYRQPLELLIKSQTARDYFALVSIDTLLNHFLLIISLHSGFVWGKLHSNGDFISVKGKENAENLEPFSG